MSAMEQLEDNLSIYSDFKPLSDEEQQMIRRLSEALRSKMNNGCTGCKYCLPCPAGVNIPKNFSIWNEYGMYQNKRIAAWQWKNNIDDKRKAKNCVSCGQCEEVCPQNINIREDLSRLQKELDSVVESLKASSK
jgi:predicted aldo/keto reductase-like oxidoreductase